MKNGKYTLVNAPEGYSGKKYRDKYIYEHHLVWWMKTKQVLPLGFQIHHINGDHRDNRIENLAMVSPIEHRKIHRELSKLRSYMGVKCKKCSGGFMVRKSYLKYKSEHNKRGVFCSKVCADKYNTIYSKSLAHEPAG